MMYWAGVYLLVIIGVAIPFILLYIAAGAVWLGFQAMRFVGDRFKHALTVRKCFVNVRWGTMHR
jgi:hypothetical protein